MKTLSKIIFMALFFLGLVFTISLILSNRTLNTYSVDKWGPGDDPEGIIVLGEAPNELQN